MKTLYTALLTFAVCSAFAQSFTLEKSSETYQELSSPVDLTGGELWDDDEWVLPLGFSFDLFGKTYTEFNVNSNGFILDSINGAEMKLGMVGPDLVDGAFLIDFNNPIPVTYELSGTAGDQILKLQWKDANVWSADSTNVVNYQVWFHEGNGNLSFHFGNTVLNTTPGITVQLYSQGAYLDDGFALGGNPSSATASTIINMKMTAAPTDGSVYTYVNIGSSGGTGVAGTTDLGSEINMNPIQLYPNPAKEFLFVNGEYDEISVVNMLGQTLISHTDFSEPVSVSNLVAGNYLIKVYSNDRVYTQKIVKH